MKAIRFHTYGGPEVLRLEEVPVPEIKSDEVLIRVHAAGVNFLDAYQRTGLYKTPLPFGPGVEGAVYRSFTIPLARRLTKAA
jgi:NADPH:quinone reductase